MLTHDAKEEKIEKMIQKRSNQHKRTAFTGWKEVVIMKKLDKGAVDWVIRRYQQTRIQEVFDHWFDHNVALSEAAAEAQGGPKRTTTAPV